MAEKRRLSCFASLVRELSLRVFVIANGWWNSLTNVQTGTAINLSAVYSSVCDTRTHTHTQMGGLAKTHARCSSRANKLPKTLYFHLVPRAASATSERKKNEQRENFFALLPGAALLEIQFPTLTPLSPIWLQAWDLIILQRMSVGQVLSHSWSHSTASWQITHQHNK